MKCQSQTNEMEASSPEKGSNQGHDGSLKRDNKIG